MEIAVDLGIVVLILGLTYALMSEGLWGAALMFFNVLFASVIALNFYEALARLITDNAGSWSFPWADLASLSLLFLVALVLLRLATDNLGPTMIRFPMPVYHAGRVLFGLAGATVTVAMLLLILNTAPVHKKLFGVAGYDTRPPFGMGLDRRYLAFFQHTTGYPFARYGSSRVDPEFGDAHVFDRQGRWLIDHEDARPFGDGWRAEAASQSGAGAAAGPAAGPGGGPGIPGGTAGAAAGLAPTENMGGF